MLLDIQNHEWPSSSSYHQIPVELLNEGLSPRSILLWGVLYSLSRIKGFAYPSNDELLWHLNVDKNTLPKMKNELVTSDFLLIQQRSGGRNNYYPLLHGKLARVFLLQSRTPSRNWGGGYPKNREGGTPKMGREGTHKKGTVTDNKKQRSKTERTQHSLVGGVSFPFEIEEVIQIVASTKCDPSSWANTMREMYYSDKLRLNSLLSEAEKVSGLSLAKTFELKRLVRKAAKEKGPESMRKFCSDAAASTIIIDGVSLPKKFIQDVLDRIIATEQEDVR